MKRVLQLLVCMVCLMQTLVVAENTGKISGTVKDKATSQAIIGATIRIDGTKLGAATDPNGDYFIINIPPGVYTVTASIVGYGNVSKKDVRIRIDQTTKVDFELSESSVQLNDVVITAERPKVEVDLTSSKEAISSEEIKNTWALDIKDLVGDVSSANINGGIRGSFGNDVSYRVDGLDLRDVGSNTNFSTVNMTTIQEVEVLTGGWNAEFGQANGSIVNIVTRKASDRIHAIGMSKMRPSGKYHWGRNFYGDEDPMYNVMTTPEFWDPNAKWKTPWMTDSLSGYKGGSAYFDTLTPQQRANWWKNFVTDKSQFPQIDYANRTEWENEVTLYGPVPGVSELNFMLSGRYKDGVGIYPSALSYNPDMTFQGSLDWAPKSSLKFGLTGVYTKFENSGPPRTFYQSSETNPSDIASQQLPYISDPYSDYKYWLYGTKGGSDQYTIRPPERADFYSAQGKMTNVFSDKTFLDVSIQHNQMHYYLDYRDIARSASFPAFGLPISEFPDTTYDLPGYGVTPPASFYSARWGYPGDIWRSNVVSRSTGIKGDLTSQILKNHLLKTGFIFSLQHFEKVSHEGGTGVGNIFAQVNDVVPIRDNPYEGAVYVQDKIEVGGMVLNAGLRFDFYNANKNVSKNIFDPLMLLPFTDTSGNVTKPMGRVGYREDGSGSNYYSTPTQTALSPRIGISHPITEATVLHFMFGKFYQRPSWNKILASPVVWTNRISNLISNGMIDADFNLPDTTSVTYRYYGQKVGNPALTWEKMTQYEIGFEQNIVDMFSLDVTMYYKDAYDLTSNGIDQGPASANIQSLGGNVDIRLYGDPTKPDDRIVGQTIGNFTTTVNGSWADVRGLEFKLGSKFDHINFDFSYNLSYLATGSYHLTKKFVTLADGSKLGQDVYSGASNTDEGGIGLDDASWNPHNSALIKLTCSTPDTWGTWAGNWSLSTSTRWAQGNAYTYYPTDYTGERTPNNMKWDDTWDTNINLNKTILFWNNLKFKVFVQVTNVFNEQHLRQLSGSQLTTYMEQGILPYQSTTKEPAEWSWYDNLPRQVYIGTSLEF